MDELLRFAVNLAFEAGRIQKKYFQKQFEIRYKGEINLVTEVDLECQAKIIELISKDFPEDTIISEEQVNRYDTDRNRWIIDPIDGTTNYAHGYPFFCTSVAYEIKGRVTHGVVYNPVFDELFFTSEGKGAYLNGERLRVSETTDLKKALLSTGFPYDVSTNERNNIREWVAFLHKTQALRRDGSAALNLSYVASGRFDGFWELRLSPWDKAAGFLIVTEAGGTVTGLAGEDFSIYDEGVVASNGFIHGAILAILKEG